MRAELLNPFVTAACEILEQELGAPPSRGPIRLETGVYQTAEISVMIGVAGAVRGAIIIGLSRATALHFAATMLGCPADEVEPLADSGMAEIANCIAGRSCALLADRGISADITTPTVLIGNGARVSTVNIPRVCMPLTTEWGAVDLQIALTT